MSFENQAHSPQLDTQKGVFEGIAMPKNITIPAEMKERFAGLSPEEQERLLPDVSFQFSTLGENLSQITKEKNKAFADTLTNGLIYG